MGGVRRDVRSSFGSPRLVRSPTLARGQRLLWSASSGKVPGIFECNSSFFPEHSAPAVARRAARLTGRCPPVCCRCPATSCEDSSSLFPVVNLDCAIHTDHLDTTWLVPLCVR